MIGYVSPRAVGAGGPSIATAGTTPRHLRRSRLHDTLAVPDASRISTIYAPAGTGKTALVVDWIEMFDEQRSAVYVDLDAGATRWWRTPLRAPSWWPSGEDQVTGLAQALHDHIPSRGAGSVVVVLDGTEAVIGAGFLSQVRRLAAGDDRLHIVLLGRLAPPDDNLQQPGSSQHSAVGWHELAFTAAETAALCANRGLDLPTAVSRHLFAVTGGWAAGLVVGAAALSGAPHEPEHVLKQVLHTGAGLSEYILQDVLGRQPAELRQAVRDSCVVESVCAGLFDALTGRADGAAVLAGLARNNMFATRLDPTSPWFRYHRLWRSALYTALVEDDPAHARRLHGAASEWYAEHGQPAEALRHALAGADRLSAVTVATRHSEEIREASPQVAVIAAAPRPWASLSADAPLAHAFAVHRGGGDATAPSRSSAPRHRRAMTGAAGSGSLQSAAASPAIHPDGIPLVDPIQTAAVPIWQALRHGDFVQAQAALTSFTPATGGRPLHRTTALRLRAVIARMAGRLDSAVRHAQDLGRTVRAHGRVGAHDDGWARLVLAEVAVQRGGHDAAVQHLDTLAVQLWQSVPALVAAQRLQAALLLQQQHRYADALEQVEQLILDRDEALLVPRWAARVLRVELLIATGRVLDAERRWRLDAGYVSTPAAAITEAKLAIALRPQDRIDGLLRPVLHEPRTSLFHQIELRLLLAHQSHTTGATRQAVDLLQQAVALADRQQIQHPFHANRRLLASTFHQLGTAVFAEPVGAVPGRTAPAGAAARRSQDLLSRGEVSVLRQLASYRTIGEIAVELHLSRNTVKTHVASIYRKLAVHSRRDAVRAARTIGILAADDLPPDAAPPPLMA